MRSAACSGAKSLAILCAMLAAPGAWAQVHKCQGGDGRITYSSEPCERLPGQKSQDRMALERHLDENVGQHRIHLRGLVHSPGRAQCERGGIRLELGPADRLKEQQAS